VRVFLKVREEGGGREVGLETTAYKSPEAGCRWWSEGECGEIPRMLPPPFPSGGVTAALE